MAMTLREFASREIRTRDDYLYFKSMIGNHPDIFPKGTDTVLSDTQMSEFRTEMKDRNAVKQTIEEVRKVTKTSDKYEGFGTVIEDKDSKTLSNIRITTVKKAGPVGWRGR